MAITAAQVKELREATGAGMMDCKNALVAVEGDLEKAIDYLRENGLMKAAKKEGRIASEGLVKLSFNADGSAASAVEVNSETDFVAKNEEFVSFVENLSDMILKNDIADMDALMAADYGSEGSVNDALTSKIATIGENMNIRRFAKCSTPGVKYVGYVHGGGRIGVIIGLRTELSAEDVQLLGKDIAMQAASMRPKFVSEAEVDPEYLAHEKEVILAQALKENEDLPEDKRKPHQIIEKMISGRLKKELKAVCLVDQEFVKDSQFTVQQYIEDSAKKLGKTVEVVEMVRYEVGEGLEKKSENFAEEVARQLM